MKNGRYAQNEECFSNEHSKNILHSSFLFYTIVPEGSAFGIFYMFHFRFKFCQICVLCPFASIFLFKKFVIQKIFVLFCDAISRGVTAWCILHAAGRFSEQTNNTFESTQTLLRESQITSKGV